jgi:hypothetical protein
MSLVKGARKSENEESSHVRKGVQLQENVKETYQVEATGRTLTSVLDSVNPPEIDFMSLDVEGYEEQVLRGLDLSKYRPTLILVEANDPNKVQERLSSHYNLMCYLSKNDVLYKLKNSLNHHSH